MLLYAGIVGTIAVRAFILQPSHMWQASCCCCWTHEHLQFTTAGRLADTLDMIKLLRKWESFADLRYYCRRLLWQGGDCNDWESRETYKKHR